MSVAGKQIPNNVDALLGPMCPVSILVDR
jgi:hypothetical protein